MIYYRPYLSNDLSEPQMTPPLTLSFSGAKIDAFQVSGVASLSNLAGKRYLREIYNLERFPAL